jgi:hypothetical protein
MWSYLKIVLFSSVLFFMSTGLGQIKTGKLSIHVKLNKEFATLWDSVFITNKDTVYRLEGNKKSGTNTILLPTGSYKVILHSKSNDQISKSITVKTVSGIQFNVERYYQNYRDTASIIKQMHAGDTSYVFYNPHVSWAPEEDYFMVIKEDDRYVIIIRNQLNTWVSIPVFDYEFAEFIDLGKYVTPAKAPVIAGMGEYYWVLGTSVLKRPCGTCMYGFLLRKHLVRMP